MLIGASIGLSRADVDFESSRGDGTVKSIAGAIYGSYFPGNAYIDAVLSYGQERYFNNRYLTVGSIQREASSRHDGEAYTAYLGAGYDFDLSELTLAPFATLRYVYLDEEGFTETGADSLNLAVNGRHVDSLVSELGFCMAHAFKLENGSLTPEISAAFGYDFDIDDQVITTSFAGSPGAKFSVKGEKVEQYGAIVGAGLTFIHRSGFSTAVKYSGEFRGRDSSQGVLGELRYSF